MFMRDSANPPRQPAEDKPRRYRAQMLDAAPCVSRSDCAPFTRRGESGRPVPDPAIVLEALFQAWHGFLYRRALRSTAVQEEAEDLVQETFCRVLERMRSQPTQTIGPSYLIRALDNAIKDEWRKRAVHRSGLQLYRSETECSRPDNAASTWAASQVPELLADALRQLSPRHRQAFDLVRIQGWSLDRAARHMGIAVKTVKEELWVACRRMREWLRAQGVSSLDDF